MIYREARRNVLFGHCRKHTAASKAKICVTAAKRVGIAASMNDTIQLVDGAGRTFFPYSPFWDDLLIVEFVWPYLRSVNAA